MFGYDKLLHAVSDMKTLLIKVLSSQLMLQSRISALESAMSRGQAADREFLLSAIQALRAPIPPFGAGPMAPSLIEDPFAELPLGHKDGYSAKELGLDSQES